MFGFRDLLWVSPGSIFHFGCPVPIQVRTNEQTYRKTKPQSCSMPVERSTTGSQNQHDAARLWVDIIASTKTKVTSTLDSTNCCHAGRLHPTGMPLGCRERDVMRHGIRPIAGRSVKPVLALLLGHDTWGMAAGPSQGAP